ncbi:hypothetical protein BOTBODRAFT_179836 [Botryobasidium botryosum FD-172 SS1]|uniref:Cytochrome P450 n=1 Tax=Botryobasidium botryosum (strain FD-172 SS1) TaxID=930990 RepID=A0A067LYJ5_BOTB1|nr:hypothetical protein BOTBODRAFT_179836 [Botryobasidium botryosum FD-172 SS1]
MEGGKFAFNEEEVIGNTFIMLFAGHGTTARTSNKIKQILPDGRDPTFEDFESFTKIRNCIQEAMRLYPPFIGFDRDLRICTSFIAMFPIDYNPRHFPDPETFKPSRWGDGSVNPDAFGGFGQGPRACIGRKFSLAEATCFAVMLLRDWRVEVDLAEGGTPQQR